MIPEIVWDPPLETESGVENLVIDEAVVAVVLVVASVAALVVALVAVQSGQFQDSSPDSCFQVQGQFIEGLSIRLRIIKIELFFHQNIKCNWLA